jgi:hypothetical protein
VDRHRFDADPDRTFSLDADPDLDLDPTPRYSCWTICKFLAIINSNVSLRCFLVLVSVIGVKIFGISDSILKF